MRGLYQQCCGQAAEQCCGRRSRAGECCGEPELICCQQPVYVGPDGLVVDPITVNFTGAYLETIAE